MIDTRLLVYFLAIAREQNMTRAAESLHVTQPTLSKQIALLEHQLGKQLFIRGKGVTLTEEGEYLRTRAQEIIDLVSVTEDTIRRENDIIGGDITIGCGETPIMGFITGIFQELHTLYPDIRFHTFSGDALTVMERLDKGLIDIGLMLGPVQQEKYDYLPLHMHDTFGILMPGNHPLAAKEKLCIEDIKEIPLALPQQLTSGNEKLEWFGDNFKKLNTVASYNLIYNATFLVEHGICLAFCLENLVETQGIRDLTFRAFEPEISVDAFIVTKKYQTFSPAVRVFMEVLRQALSSESSK